MSTVISELVAEGVVTEVGALRSDGGRPRQLLRIAPDHAYVVGVDVGEHSVRATLHDLSMKVLAAADVPLPDGPVVADVVRAIRTLTSVTMSDAAVPSGSVLGVGIGVPGIVTHEPEPFVHSQVIGWDGVPLRRLLDLGLPVAVGNGTRAMGQAELWFGAGRGARNVVFAKLDYGVSASSAADRGSERLPTLRTCEWGHTSVSVDGPRCRCGTHGCLETYVGADAIARRYARARGKRIRGGSRKAIATLVSEAPEDPTAAGLIEEMAGYLGVGIANLVNLFQPDRVVLGGWVGLELGPALLPELRRVLASRTLRQPLARTELRLAELRTHAETTGAATLQVERFLALGARPVPG
ncbi:ROK family protein [Kribbella caucasensis]|uniref:ROK family protein n=1 Tax=Kribbella caucasensis TaxID=2512215 RepID=UPI001414CFB8|nr:ROK family protein [Kribbella sp. VKM Ac-2527]